MFIYSYIHTVFITFVFTSAQDQKYDYQLLSQVFGQALIQTYGEEEVYQPFGRSLQEHFFDIRKVTFDVDLTTLKCTLKVLSMSIPFPLLPYSTSDVKFLLWTRNNFEDTKQVYLLPDSPESLAPNFGGKKKTYFFFHGFRDIGTKELFLQAKNRILTIEDVNIISVDYNTLVKGPLTNYGDAVCNIYKIANHTAYFIKWLNKVTRLSTDNIHLIGYSLGAQLAGMVGEFITKNFPPLKIARITGLDPAGPLFKKLEIKKRLNKFNAVFVDVIHTNGCHEVWKCLGLSDQSGHIDFYPNGGEIQEGCAKTDSACSHRKSGFYFMESIVPLPTNRKVFKSLRCSSWEDYIRESCVKNCTSTTCLDMGFNLRNPGLDGEKFYLETEANPPYAKGELDSNSEK